MQSLASILLALLQMGLHLLEKLDAASAADFRRRVADDGAGVLLDQLNPGHTGTAAVLPSLQRASLNGTMGLWMDSDDAGHLAAWIHDVTGENGL